MSEKETSSLSMRRVECPHCGAVWINGQHYWRTGSSGSEIDLAGLICNTPYGNEEQCLNPMIGMEGGDTWEKRMKYIKSLQDQTPEP